MKNWLPPGLVNGLVGRSRLLPCLAAAWLTLATAGSLRAGLQDNWGVDHAFAFRGTVAPDGFGATRSIDAIQGWVDPSGNVYIRDNYESDDTTVYDGNGVFLKTLDWANNKSMHVGLDGRILLWTTVIVGPPGGPIVPPAPIEVRDSNGTLLSSINTGFNVAASGTPGGGASRYSAQGFMVARDANGETYVIDAANSVVRVFNPGGTLVRTIGEKGTAAWQLATIESVVIGRGDVVAVSSRNDSSAENSIKLFRKDGTFVSSLVIPWISLPRALSILDDGLIVTVPIDSRGVGMFPCTIYTQAGKVVANVGPASGLVLAGGVVENNGFIANPANGAIYTFDRASQKMLLWRRGYRTLGAHPARLVPMPEVRVSTQRANGWIDIDYSVADGDSATVQTALAAFKTGTGLIRDLVPIPVGALVDGTSAHLGTGLATGVNHRITWDPAGSALTTGNVTFEIFAQDDRAGLLDIDFITLPGTSTTISRTPLTHADMRAAWAWLLATGHAALSRAPDGEITGPGGTFTTTFTSGSTSETRTTAEGRAWLLGQLGVRECTGAELAQARKASSPGTGNEFAPSSTQKMGDRPRAVNEWTFDSSSQYGTEAWWVVKL